MEVDSTELVFQRWMFPLPMQQQSVLVLACRGPDGVGKFHPTKEIVCRYRATVLKAAYLGRPMGIDEGDDTTFMTLLQFSDDAHWQGITRTFFDHVDEIEHHYFMHLAHGAEIIGYKHPGELFRRRWLSFYHACCPQSALVPGERNGTRFAARRLESRALGLAQAEARDMSRLRLIIDIDAQRPRDAQMLCDLIEHLAENAFEGATMEHGRPMSMQTRTEKPNKVFRHKPPGAVVNT